MPTASTISKTALRGLDQLQELQGGFGLKMRPPATLVDQIVSLSRRVSGLCSTKRVISSLRRNATPGRRLA